MQMSQEDQNRVFVARKMEEDRLFETKSRRDKEEAEVKRLAEEKRMEKEREDAKPTPLELKEMRERAEKENEATAKFFGGMLAAAAGLAVVGAGMDMGLRNNGQSMSEPKQSNDGPVAKAPQMKMPELKAPAPSTPSGGGKA